ncbi:MAG: DUF1232 domain-containing protein [Firmicutes bacterium]|nr:DUF1232 domain-containing protein [Bacillota bacterium]
MRSVNISRITAVLKALMRKAGTQTGQREIQINFNKKLKSAKGIDGIFNKLKVMYQYFLDDEVLMYKKLIIGAVLLYFINPIDIIPDVFAGVGFLDDTIAVLYGWNLLSEELEHYMESKRSGVVNARGEVVYDVEYSVNDES